MVSTSKKEAINKRILFPLNRNFDSISHYNDLLKTYVPLSPAEISKK